MSTRRTWEAPIVLSAVSAAGLVFALLADGIWDVLSWIGLGIPVAACAWYAWRPQRT